MANLNERMNESLQTLVAGVPGEEILIEFKKILITESVFRKLFGETGERIFIDKTYNLNNQIVPLLELRWKTDSQKSHDTYLNGRIEGRMIFPNSLIGGNFNIKRRIALMFLRLIGSDKFDLWERVPGLIMFGQDISLNYSVAFNVGLASLPGILIDIPYQVDLHLWKRAHPEIDPLEELGGVEFSIESYAVEIQVEKDGEIETVASDIIINGDP